MLNDLRFRLRALLRRNVVESELDEELRFHFEHEVEKHTRAGMTTEEARRRTRLTFGGHEQVKEDCREAHGTGLFETLFQDIRYGLRVHRKSPSFFIIAALTLALGIGASTAVFSVVNTILLKSSPYPNANRVVVPWRVPPIGSAWETGNFPWSDAEFVQLAQTNTVFQNLGAFRKDNFNLTGSDNPRVSRRRSGLCWIFSRVGYGTDPGSHFHRGGRPTRPRACRRPQPSAVEVSLWWRPWRCRQHYPLKWPSIHCDRSHACQLHLSQYGRDAGKH